MNHSPSLLNLGIKHCEISTDQTPIIQLPESPSTPMELFINRKIRYTVSMNGNYETRETICEKFSSEITAFFSKGAKLIGIDKINGYKCGPTDEEILLMSHPFEDEPN